MRSLLEKAIVHLLNEDNDAATQLFHQFMVEKARQIHNSLRQGDEVVLSEGWDDEINKEEYFADGDLEDLEDHPDDVDSDMDGDVDPMDGDDTDFESDGDMSAISGEEGEDDFADDQGDEGGGEVAERLGNIEDQLEDLSREFEAMMKELDGGEGDEIGAEDDFDDMTADNSDDMDADADVDSDVEDDTTEETDDFSSDEDAVEESSEMDEEELDDITESVIAELEKVLVGNMTTDGEEVGAGGKIKNGNDKSSLTMKKANPEDAKPYVIKDKPHVGYERETPPVTPKKVALKSRQTTNDTTGKAGAFKSVPKGGDAGALLNKDFAGLTKKNTKSPID